MTGRKLALVAASLAGAAVLTWTVVETLRDRPDQDHAAMDALADSPIARMVARVGPPDSAAIAAQQQQGAWWGRGWEDWRRAGADLRAGGDMTGNSDGELAYLRGRSFWDGEPDLDSGGGRTRRPGNITAARAGSAGERRLRGHPYHLPQPGKPTILTSGRRIDTPRLSLPDTDSVGLAMRARSGVPVRIEVCVNEKGRPSEARLIEGTGVAAVDRYVARQMLAGRYRPLSQDGRPVAFCERSTIVLRRLQPIHVVKAPTECGPDC